MDEIGIPLIGLGTEKAVEPLESAADRPIPFRGSKIHLVFCAQVPFTDHRGAESLLDQNLGERGHIREGCDRFRRENRPRTR